MIAIRHGLVKVDNLGLPLFRLASSTISWLGRPLVRLQSCCVSGLPQARGAPGWRQGAGLATGLKYFK